MKEQLQLETIIDKYGLTIHNQGRQPTYESKLGKSIIDVTLSNRFPLKIQNWRVNRSFIGSDHNTILFHLVTDIIEIPAHRDYSQANWTLFKNELSQINSYTPSIINQKKLDKMVYKLTNSIEDITEQSLPAKLVNKNNPWWTPQIADLRKELTALYRRYINNKDDKLHVNYKKVYRKYKNMCTKAKNKHRKRENEIIPDEGKMAKHIKNISEQISPQIGSILKPDGSTSLIGKDTHDAIMATHFPQYSELKTTSYNKHISVLHTDLDTLFNDWLSTDRIIIALNSFKDKKNTWSRWYETHNF